MDFQKQLKVKIPSYFRNKKEADKWKKVADIENKTIKELMESNDVREFESDGIKAVLSNSERVSFNEEKLMQKLKELKTKGIIKKKEYVDMDALESAIYNGEVDGIEIADCREIKNILTLRISEVK